MDHHDTEGPEAAGLRDAEELPVEEPGEELPGEDLLGGDDELDDEELSDEDLQFSTGGGMGPESYPPEADDDYAGNGAGRGPS